MNQLPRISLNARLVKQKDSLGCTHIKLPPTQYDFGGSFLQHNYQSNMQAIIFLKKYKFYFLVYEF